VAAGQIQVLSLTIALYAGLRIANTLRVPIPNIVMNAKSFHARD
jgi:H+/gluconate symporter-like permease